MKKHIKIILIFLLFSAVSYSVNAQNCTVNAGVPQSICADEILTLSGSNGGLIAINAVWSQVSGPAVTIVNPSALVTNVTGTSTLGGQMLVFKITATCDDGKIVSDQVAYTIYDNTIADAGINLGLHCETDVAGLNANAPGVGETGKWTVSPSNAGISFTDDTDPNTSINFAATQYGDATLTWTITGPNCSSSDAITVTNIGGVSPVSAGGDAALDECYTSSQSYRFTASYPGFSGAGQAGLWTTVNGPTLPSFDDTANRRATVSGLIEGVYTFRWSVSGPCVSGSDDIIVTVPAPTQDVTNVDFGSTNLVYCDARTSTTLSGVVPQYVGETILWTQTSGPGGAIITTDASSSTTITGLDGSSNYSFTYTIISPVSVSCTSADVINISYTNPPTITVDGGSDYVSVPCGNNSILIPYIATGGNNVQWSIISAPTPGGLTSYANTSGGNVTISNLNEPGTYLVRFRNQSNGAIGCPNAFDDINLVVSKNPTASNAGTNQVLACNVVATDLAGNVPIVGVGVWSQVSGPNTAIIADAYLNTSNISNLTDGEYIFKWVISAGNGCDAAESTVSVFVSSATPTTAIAGPNPSEPICAGSEYTMQANMPIAGAEVGTWSVSPSAGIVFEDINSPTTKVIGFAASTAYTFTWTIAVNCDATASANAVVLTTDNTIGATPANAGPDVCEPSGTNSITLSGVSPGAGTGAWLKLSGPAATITDLAQNNTTVTGLVDGNYVFEWTTTGSAGCITSTDQVAVTISADVTTSNAGTDLEVCGTSINLAGNTPLIGIGTWAQEMGSAGVVIADANAPTSLLSNLQPGVYTFSWTISNGVCPTQTDIVKVTVGGIPATIADAGGPHADVCGTSTTLAGNVINNGSGVWSLVGSAPNAPVIADETDPITTVSSLISGTYTFRWTSYGGQFCPVTTDDVVINVLEPANAGSDQGLCDVTNTVLVGNAATTGTWTQVDANAAVTLTVTAPNTVSVTNMVINTTYEFQYVIASALVCPNKTDNVIVQVDGFGTNPTAGPDQELCDVASISFAANTPVTGVGLWSKVSGPAGGLFVDASLANATFNNPGYGVYVFQWEVSNGNCSFSDVVRVENAEPPSASNAGPDQLNVCPPVIQLAANLPAVGLGTWSINSVPGGSTAPVFSSLVSPDATVTLVETGAYVFAWTITNGSVCAAEVSSVTITVANLAPTTPMAGVDQELCNVTSTTMAANTITTGAGFWSRISGPNIPAITSPSSETSTITGMVAGSYVFRWTATSDATDPTNPCIVSDDVAITIYDNPTVSAPTATIDYCQFDTFVLDGNPVGTGAGLWTQVSGPTSVAFVDATDPTTEITAVAVGIYIFKWSISNGVCTTSEANETITVNALPATPAITGDAVVCMGSTITNLTSTAGTIVWSSSDPGVATINAATGEVTPVASGDTNITYKVTDGNMCFAISDPFVVTVNGVTGGSIAADQAIASGANVAAFTQAVASTGEGVLSYQWQSSTTSSIAGFSNIGGATSTTYDHGIETVDTWFKRITTSTVSAVNCMAESNVLAVSINAVLTITDVSANEDDGSITVTVSLDRDVTGGFTVDVSTIDGTATIADMDYTPITNQTLTFVGTANEIQTFTVTPTVDAKVESNETITVGLSNLANTGFTVNITDDAIITFTNDDAAMITVENVSGNEDDGAITLTVTLDNPVDGGFTVDVSTADGTATTADSDYTSVVAQTITFTGNASETQTFTVTPTSDINPELSEDLTVNFSNLANSALGVDITDNATVTIINDDTAVLTIADISANEDDGTITVTVTLDKAVPGGFTIDVSTVDGTASTGDNDYTAVINQTLAFVGTVAETHTFTVTPTVDAKVENDETLSISMVNLLGTGLAVDITDVATITINNDDSASITIADVSANEDDGSITVTLTLDNPVAGGFTVDVSSADGTATIADMDYTSITNQTLTFVGTTNEIQTFIVTPTVDAKVEIDETIMVGLSNLANTGLTVDIMDDAIITFTNDDAAMITVENVSGNEDDGAITLTVTLDNPVEGGFTVDVSTTDGTATTSDSDYTAVVAQTITFTGNSAENQTFTVTPTADTNPEVDEDLTVSFANLSNTGLMVDISDEATVTIINDDDADLSITNVVDNTSPDINTNVVFTLQIKNNGPTDDSNVTVTELVPSGYNYVSHSVTKGGYDAGTGIWTVGDFNVNDTETLEITAKVLASGIYDNTATISGDENDPNLSNNTATSTVVPVAKTDLMVVKTPDSTTPFIDFDMVFTLIVTNNGPDNATNVAITDMLQDGYVFVSDNPTVGSYDATSGIWTVGNLANGATEKLEITVTVKETGSYVNTATITGDELDTDSSNNTSTVTPVPEFFNQPPLAEDDFAEVDYGGVLEGESVLENDSDPDNDPITITTTPVVDVAHGTLVLNDDGSYIYTPDYNYDGPDGFVYEICDGVASCTTAEVFITVNPVVGVIVPEGFSPNGDGINDFLVIPGIEKYPNASLIIINRWGNKVSEYTNGYLNDWEGTNQFGINVGGDQLPEGTYFLILDLNDSSEVIRASVYLKR